MAECLPDADSTRSVHISSPRRADGAPWIHRPRRVWVPPAGLLAGIALILVAAAIAAAVVML